ncbi:MAG: helix-turn-helix transcriptional regulator [Myxococcaceae bacterium]
MNKEKRERLEKAGFKLGSVQDFLQLTNEETAYIEVKLALAKTLAEQRKKTNHTQLALAKKLHSSQSRVAKMEAGDPSVSLDLIVHALFAVGYTPRQLGHALVGA